MQKSSLNSTRWSKHITEDNVWKQYPRPAMVRSSYYNLNGFWEYCFTPTEKTPESYNGTILVPFSPESPLSGVERQLQPDEFLWYRRIVKVPHPAGSNRLLLHFGAVDQTCAVFINGHEAGNHMGGYLPFTIDITEYLPSDTSEGFELSVRVRDVSDTSWHSRGKQKLKRGGMFYTAQSGIWQTVWMEEVPDAYISSVKITPDFDGACCRVSASIKNSDISDDITLTALVRPENRKDLAFRDCPDRYPETNGRSEMDDPDILVPFSSGKECIIPLPEFHPWTPEDPFLYHLTLETADDRVECYFAMRKCDVQTDTEGIRRLFLNNRPYLHAGVLDQGYWPDGLYTAPCDEALVYDIASMKDLGFNMLRKHIKIEPQRWYYHCDRLGMLVWQDMVCGGTTYQSWFVTYLATVMSNFHISIGDGPLSRGLLSRKDPEGRDAFYSETRETIQALYNHPSIVVWVPFNEGWGQFDALKVTEFIRGLDNTRVIDHASGWYDQKGGDLASLHYYFLKLTVKPEKVRALVLSEFGGYTWQIPEHSYSQKEYGYGKYDSRESLTAGYSGLLENLIIPAVEKGISATVYTQVSDIEDEVNGIFTYDREILKLEPDAVRVLNQKMKDILG